MFAVTELSSGIAIILKLLSLWMRPLVRVCDHSNESYWTNSTYYGTVDKYRARLFD